MVEFGPVNRADRVDSDWLLIADEDPGFARVLQILLEEERPYRVLMAYTAHDAIAALVPHGRPVAIICQLELQSPTGASLTSWFRRSRPEIPMLTTTAHPAEGSRVLASQLGISAYLSKPVDPGELLMELDRAVGG